MKTTMAIGILSLLSSSMLLPMLLLLQTVSFGSFCEAFSVSNGPALLRTVPTHRAVVVRTFDTSLNDVNSLMGKVIDSGNTAAISPTSSFNLDDPMMIAVVAAGVIGIGGIVLATSAASNSNENGDGNAKQSAEPEPEPIDVTIPYDAAAVLKFKSFQPEFSKAEYEEIVALPVFEEFNKQYKDVAATETALKVKKAKLEAIVSSA